MTPQQIARRRAEIQSLRRWPANVRNRELVSLAESLGWRHVATGSEPRYRRPGRGPLFIPNHPGALKKVTVKKIPDLLEEHLDEEEATGDGAEES